MFVTNLKICDTVLRNQLKFYKIMADQTMLYDVENLKPIQNSLSRTQAVKVQFVQYVKACKREDRMWNNFVFQEIEFFSFNNKINTEVFGFTVQRELGMQVAEANVIY